MKKRRTRGEKEKYFFILFINAAYYTNSSCVTLCRSTDIEEWKNGVNFQSSHISVKRQNATHNSFVQWRKKNYSDSNHIVSIFFRSSVKEGDLRNFYYWNEMSFDFLYSVRFFICYSLSPHANRFIIQILLHFKNIS